MNFRMYIIASWAVARDEGITGIAFMAKRLHVVSLAVCSYGPIGEQNNEDHYNVRLGVATSFYDSANEQGITTLGYHGCFNP